jgi:hypothetical protein
MKTENIHFFTSGVTTFSKSWSPPPMAFHKTVACRVLFCGKNPASLSKFINTLSCKLIPERKSTSGGDGICVYAVGAFFTRSASPLVFFL